MSEIDIYDFELPRELVAQQPLPTRSDARLMLVNRRSGTIEHHHVRDLPDLLRSEDTLVLNDSRVIPARMIGFRTRTGGRWQGLFLRADADSGIWEVLTKTRGKLVAGETITVEDRNGLPGMRLEVVARTNEGHLLVMPRPATESFGQMSSEGLDEDSPPHEWLQRYGRVPLPPYIRDGHMVDDDVERYQTVFSKTPGSVAAPTAGLHFTPPLLKQIQSGGTETASVTLHVGLGTFRPVATESLDDHVMHTEWAEISEENAALINERRTAGGRCVAVGTTSVRTLESAAAALDGALDAWSGTTDLFIRPPYQFKVVDALMTNFHLPKSTLLILVSALAGRELILEAYAKAVESEYRFFSYGDAMLIV
ncbi:tRNA preQ1(34) S-adenosylmethionine ribosyltransferase-isomerase QueA [Rhodopirellula sp. MGV]|uniref:tRNA preQ1(34) S-adenosylmethionine ribosyltransferase-isomerase QueA n=1 Tax=Rhodopirellula sp. MGV TaxID=2023130 RepID=UPI000B962CE1|nr:tRNA preQ1(34) S-adenosylmethionine ribosyltransferase-isomerase QueA [Rhodopirellula sp. MGV]OYP33796.1 tRNA preQ1(34) S-adenosylmethionine ribosyltransferase-isomerase QueA [Rhodopirellula sp. MGV]PNY37540.1 tRNA preQ1(34) S-adenosylmethionine ribosyltransferase-isomerase QueA [Rhodopirellula baltica]